MTGRWRPWRRAQCAGGSAAQRPCGHSSTAARRFGSKDLRCGEVAPASPGRRYCLGEAVLPRRRAPRLDLIAGLGDKLRSSSDGLPLGWALPSPTGSGERRSRLNPSEVSPRGPAGHHGWSRQRSPQSQGDRVHIVQKSRQTILSGRRWRQDPVGKGAAGVDAIPRKWEKPRGIQASGGWRPRPRAAIASAAAPPGVVRDFRERETPVAALAAGVKAPAAAGARVRPCSFALGRPSRGSSDPVF